MQRVFYRYTIIVYSTILLVSLALFYLLPKNALVELDFDPGVIVESEIYREAELKGNLEQMEGIQVHSQWSFDYSGDRLDVASDSDEAFVVKRTAAGTGEVTAVEYRRETFVTHRLNPYQVSLSGNRLHIQNPGRYEFRFKGFDKDFTTNQFSEKEMEKVQYHVWLSHDLYFAQELCLYIPADVEIDYDPAGISLIIVNEE